MYQYRQRIFAIVGNGSCQYWFGHLARTHTGKERHCSNANTGTGTWQVPLLEMNAIAAMPILVWALGKCLYWK
jgi:hypothetical protein